MRHRTLVLLAGLQLAAVASAHAARVEIILDVSGSMRARLGPETKMDAARKAIRATVQGVEPGSVVGLRLYGHRVPQENKAESCRDTELAVPFQPLDQASFLAVVDRAVPRGQTPLTYSLEQAAHDFGPASDEERVIILVSDGAESCGGDPTAAARSLQAQGFKVKVHTIGFDVDAAARAQLEALSTATGGEYHDARDAAALADSLTRLAQRSLLVAKGEEALGEPVRGGDGYETAVALQSGRLYRLDHHQRRGQYDYFYLEVAGPKKVTATIETGQTGVTISGDSFRDSIHPSAGIVLQDSSRRKLGDAEIVQGRGEKKELVGTVVGGRLYVLVGSTYTDQHKDSRFQVSLADVPGDAGSPNDAGDTEAEAVPISPGTYGGYLDSQDKADVFKFTADPQATYRVRVRQAETRASIELSVENPEANLSRSESGMFGKAPQVVDLRFGRGGDVFVSVAHSRFASHVDTGYSLEVVQSGGSSPAAAGGSSAAPAAPAQGGPSAPALLARVASFAVWSVLPLVFGLVVGGGVGYLLGRRKR